MKRLTTLALGLMLSVTGALAGPIADFNADLASAYAKYRTVLFKTNQGDSDASTKAIADFASAWQGLADHWRSAPPPQFSEDGEWGGTLDSVAALAAKAGEEIAAGKLPEAHETLEAVRDEVARLNARNGIITFSDRMNDYHAVMEHVLKVDYSGPGGSQRAIADAGVLAYLAGQLGERAPPAFAADPEFIAAIAAMKQSVGVFAAAAARGDAAAIKAAQPALKKTYAMAFVRFG
jgi:hypothetical protein